MAPGVSVVLCCYNSAGRLPRTLAHLAVQQVPKTLNWEVIVVDNVSEDKTRDVALESWNSVGAVPLRVVRESRSGLAFARNRGLTEAKYDIVSFVDDDNWVCPEWVELVWNVMKEHSDVGACGGFSEAFCEVKPPKWFEDHKASYAIGPEGIKSSDMTNAPGWLWGAGLSVRKSAWQHLVSNGFFPLLVGRQPGKLGSGDDSELCFALRLAGWRLWHEPRLRFQHFLPAERLKWSYLRKLHRAFGASTVAHDPYLFALRSLQALPKGRPLWARELISVVKRIYWSKRSFLSGIGYFSQGNAEILQIDRDIGRCFELLHRRIRYDLSIREIQRAGWRRIG